MGGSGNFDLEKNFAFCAAYHNHKINVLMHKLFVWPILLTLGIMLAYTKPLTPQFPFIAALPFHEYMMFNWSFVAESVYVLFYIIIKPKLGSWAALLVIFCWIGANAVAQQIPFASGWKVK
nr:uncharacterized protein LOC112283260 [Physcomitrium patens]|eukprot:XP_024377524.1 uncharacterized protein LOC112283260 [Physcomitrella patens]